MKKDIVVFELYDDRIGSSELDFRLLRQSLPVGSCPLAIADGDGFRVRCGQWFKVEEVKNFAEEKSGYFSECPYHQEQPLDPDTGEPYKERRGL
jgi:hypothetical protein